MRSKTISSLEIMQPVFAAPVFLSVVAGSPPMWAAWLIALSPWLLYVILARRFIRRTAFDIPILIYCIGLIIGFLVSPDKRISSEGLLTTLASVSIYYGLVNNKDRRRRYWVMMSSLCGIVILGLIIWFFSQGDTRVMYFNEWLFQLTAQSPKTAGPVLQFNSLGIFLAIAIPLLLSVAVFGEGPRRRLALAAVAFLSTVLFLSTSGGGWGAAVCGIIFVLAVRRLQTLWLTLPATGIGIAVIAVNYHQFSWPSRIFDTDSLSSRIDIWLKTVGVIKESWFTGLGLGTWSEAIEGYIHAHNSYIQLYTDTGLTGILALIVAFALFVRISRRIIKAPGRSPWYGIGTGITGGIMAGAAASVFDVITYGAFRTPDYHYVSIPLLWIMAALLVISDSRLRAPVRPGS